MTDPDRDKRLYRMIDLVVSRRQETRLENLVFLLLLVLIDGLLVIANRGHLVVGSDHLWFAASFVAVNTVLFFAGYHLRRRRKAALLDFVMPRDQSGGRRVDQKAYIFLAAEHRAIEEADFRRKLAKSIKNNY